MMRKKRNRIPFLILVIVLIISIHLRVESERPFLVTSRSVEEVQMDSSWSEDMKQKLRLWLGEQNERLASVLEKIWPNEEAVVSYVKDEDNQSNENTIELEESAPDPIAWSDTFYPNIPILMYHVVEDVPDGNSLFLSPEHFQEHLEYFEAAGIHPVTMQQVYEHWENGQPLPEKPIVLTFDDGYRSMYTEVWPRLKEKGWPGVFYIYTKAIGWETNLTTDMLQEMASSGMEIASHSVSHLDMSTLSTQQLYSELWDSKTTLEQITGEQVTSFCYPSGSYNDTTWQTVQEAGYQTAVTTQYGVANNEENFYTLSRIRISKGDNGNALQEKLKAVNNW